MKLRIIATTVTTAALLATTGVAAANAAPAVPTSDNCQFGQHLLHAWLRLPADLRGDLAALRDLDSAERADAARDIREGALDGQYGPGVQEGAEKLRVHRATVWTHLPENLRSDLVDLRKADPADRRALAEDIAQGALAGEYGERAQLTAERIQSSDAWQDCVAG